VHDSLVTSCGHVYHANCCRQSECVSVKQYGQWSCPSCREPVSFVRTIFTEENGLAPNILEGKPSSSTAKQLLAVMQSNDLIAGTISGLLGVEEFVVGTLAEHGREPICAQSSVTLHPYEAEALTISSPPELEREPSTPDNTHMTAVSELRHGAERTNTGMSALSFTSMPSIGDSMVDVVLDVMGPLPSPAAAAHSDDGSADAAVPVQVKRKLPAVLSGVLDVSAFGNSAAGLDVLGQLGLTWVVEDGEAALRERHARRLAEGDKRNRVLRVVAIVFVVMAVLAAALVLYFMRKKFA